MTAGPVYDMFLAGAQGGTYSGGRDSPLRHSASRSISLPYIPGSAAHEMRGVIVARTV